MTRRTRRAVAIGCVALVLFVAFIASAASAVGAAILIPLGALFPVITTAAVQPELCSAHEQPLALLSTPAFRAPPAA